VVRYTLGAELDLAEIAAYTVQKWGAVQCAVYLRDLRDCCQRLADNPMLGRVDTARPRYRRYECGRHVVFFRRETAALVVVRILHQRQLPEPHLDSGE
jgi:toxin ParE1/3/4